MLTEAKSSVKEVAGRSDKIANPFRPFYPENPYPPRSLDYPKICKSEQMTTSTYQADVVDSSMKMISSLRRQCPISLTQNSCCNRNLTSSNRISYRTRAISWPAVDLSFKRIPQALFRIYCSEIYRDQRMLWASESVEMEEMKKQGLGMTSNGIRDH